MPAGFIDRKVDGIDETTVIPLSEADQSSALRRSCIRRTMRRPTYSWRTVANGSREKRFAPAANVQERVDRLISAYRNGGHLIATLDPLGLARGSSVALDIETFGLDKTHWDECVSTPSLPGADSRSIRDVVEWLRRTYCGNIGVEYCHIDESRQREWLRRRFESKVKPLGDETRLCILEWLTSADQFEQYLQKKYVAAKSFSLEGAESLLPLLILAIEQAAKEGTTDIVLGMAHRGRLNVMANVIGKRPAQIFREFEDVDPQRCKGCGDVKYHLGASGDWETADGLSVHLSLCFNASHLEFVCPIALGRTRAKQIHAGSREKVMTILIHGDAGFAGEGIVQETLNLSKLEAYDTGGAIHIVVNNQIGFTTQPHEGRTSSYPTDVARMLQAPIFHVNGDDVDAVARAARLAMEYRAKFHRDALIDLFCFRRHGHNESDEPSFTQPIMYRKIHEHAPVQQIYARQMQDAGLINKDRIQARESELCQRFDAEYEDAQADTFDYENRSPAGIWRDFFGGPATHADVVNTGVDQETLRNLIARLTDIPDEFNVHRTLCRAIKRRRETKDGKRPVDWATAEAMAFATLAVQGIRVRMSGQDSERGTFSQRHAVLHDSETGRTHQIFANLDENQSRVEIRNSPLSEAGVLGFEYGYSLDSPNTLVLWEAQFGDFVNAAQVIVDQFLTSAEDKWRRLSGIVLLLPHGFEGMGPEHSSARLERFLTLAAEDNVQIVSPSTPAQYFHLLRRQALRKWRKPLIVLTPKSLLRHKLCVSTLAEFAADTFAPVVEDTVVPSPGDVSRVLLCTGKIYYGLAARREETKRHDVAIVRLEQLYPLEMDRLQEVVEAFPEKAAVAWVQEEPSNMGAWRYLHEYWNASVSDRPLYSVTRAESASPATGSASSHEWEQEHLITRAFETTWS